MSRFQILTPLALLFAVSLGAAPIITTGADPVLTGDLEWLARARNMDNRGGTWKPIIFGDDTFTNNANAVSSNTNWTIVSNTVSGAFSLTFTRTGAGPLGTATFKTANHNITNPNVGVDTDANDGKLTHLVLYAIDSNDSTVSLTNLVLTYGTFTVNLPSIATLGGSTVGNAFVGVSNLMPIFGDGFTLKGNYSIAHDGSVADEAPRFEIKALSGGTTDNAVPEPSTLALLGIAAGGLALLRRKSS